MAATLVLALDIGNTNTRAGLIDCDGLSCLGRESLPTKDTPDGLGHMLENAAGPAGRKPPVVICSVAKIDRAAIDASVRAAGFAPPLWLEHTPRFPVKISYDNAASLGHDRLADCLYAYAAHPGKSRILIDAGTAITVDFLENGLVFAGGTILPGVTTQLKSLHEYTAALPPVELDESATEFPGTSTTSAMIAGVTFGTAGALSFLVARYKERFGKDALVLATGGAWRLVEKLVEFEYEYVTDMTLIGTGLYWKLKA
jgi:type III pantothenate kinase